MGNKGITRVGKAKRVKLEIPYEERWLLPEPIAARAATLPDGRLKVVFQHDSASPYKWGQPNEQYGVIGVEIPADRVEYEDPEAESRLFTFSKPDQITRTQNRVEVVMPANLPPPRPTSRTVYRPRKAPPPAPALAESPVEAAPAPEVIHLPPIDLFSLVRSLNDGVAACGATVTVRNGRVVVRQVCQ